MAEQSNSKSNTGKGNGNVNGNSKGDHTSASVCLDSEERMELLKQCIGLLKA